MRGGMRVWYGFTSSLQQRVLLGRGQRVNRHDRHLRGLPAGDKLLRNDTLRQTRTVKRASTKAPRAPPAECVSPLSGQPDRRFEVS